MSQIFFTHASKPTTTTSTTSTSSTSSLLKRNISTTTTKTTTNAAASVSLTPPTSTTSVKSLFNNRNLKTFIALTGLSCTGTLLYIQSQRHHQSLPTTTTTTTIATTTTTTTATNAATLKRKVTSAQHLLGGTVGGILGIVASYPFDTVKVKIQTQSHLYPSKMIDCFKFIVKNEGVS